MSDIPRRLGGAPDSRLDRAIDRAVRDMMQVDPRPGFRGRVLAHLDGEPVRSTMFWRLGFAGAALAVIAFAVTLTTWRRETPPAVTVAQQQPPTVTLPDIDFTASQPEQSPSPQKMQAPKPNGVRHPGRATRELIPIPQVDNVFGERNTGTAATSVDIDAVWPAPGAQTADDRPGMLAPLVIPALEPPAPIVIAPLNPRGPGGGRP
jgi:hypothetical protein